MFRDAIQRQAAVLALAKCLPRVHEVLSDPKAPPQQWPGFSSGELVLLRLCQELLTGGFGGPSVCDVLYKLSPEPRAEVLSFLVSLHRGPEGIDEWIANRGSVR